MTKWLLNFFSRWNNSFYQQMPSFETFIVCILYLGHTSKSSVFFFGHLFVCHKTLYKFISTHGRRSNTCADLKRRMDMYYTLI